MTPVYFRSQSGTRSSARLWHCNISMMVMDTINPGSAYSYPNSDTIQALESRTSGCQWWPRPPVFRTTYTYGIQCIPTQVLKKKLI